MKKINALMADESKRNSFFFPIMVVVFALTIYIGGTARGFISTFPIFFFAAAGIFFFYNKLKTAIVMTAILSLTFSLVDSTGFNSTARTSPELDFAFIKVIFFILTAFLAYVAVKFFREKGKMGYIKAAILIVLYLICFNFVFGNIFGAVSTHTKTKAYLSENYPNQPIENASTAFNFKSHYYETSITFKEPFRSYFGEEKIVPEDNYDGYFLYAKSALFDIGKSTMREAVREVDKNTIFTIESLPFEENIERSMFDLGGDYGLVFPLLSYKIIIQDDLPKIESFREKCQEYVDALKGKFEYKTLKFYGGEKGIFLFEANVSKGVEIVDAVPFDKGNYVK